MGRDFWRKITEGEYLLLEFFDFFSSISLLKKFIFINYEHRIRTKKI